ncbi:MAG: hypothetical protein B6244_05855 [Candidatus Cloacimonetes bacterium 4572_55]|nr:MAG: hypothetical protein B6244_05855 [Candidatus Cloacimonetes bacterium 4572_55]
MEDKNIVLIIDDEPHAQETATGLLHREGYQLLSAESGREALERLRKNDVDVILMDVMMPEMNGFELCWYVKRQKNWQHIPIILLTALDTKEDLARGLDAGADDFLTKPIRGVELRARVRSMLRIKKQYDELQDSLKLREDLSNILIKEMRAPLSNILLGADAIRKMVDFADSIQNYGDQIYQDAYRLNGYIDDVMLMTRMKSGQLILSYTNVNIPEMITDVGQFYQKAAGLKGIELTFDFNGQGQIVSMDKILFRRMMDNLLFHVIEHSHARQIQLVIEFPESDEDDLSLRIRLIDDGETIPPEYHYRIFEISQIPSLKNMGVAQVGFGLAFCKTVVKAHGGTISLFQNAPSGSIFTVEI